MNVQEFILVSGFVLTIATVVAGIAFLHGRGEAWRESMSQQFTELKAELHDDGPDGFVRHRELEMLHDQAEREHGRMWATLGDHDGRIKTLERIVP